MTSALRLPYLRPDLPAAVVSCWQAMGDLGKIRRHRRSGRLYLDFPGKRRLWTTRVGGAALPFGSEAEAGRDARDGWLTVARARKGKRLDDPVRGTKTGRVKRLPMPAELVAWLEEQPPRAPGSPLFPNPRTGGRWTPTSLRRTWQAACVKVGVSVGLYEGTKHSMGTAAKTAGVEDRVLAQVFGHSDVRSVERYAKLGTEVVRSALGRLPRGKT